ncbi:MAG: hypothetical protein ACOCP8_07980 [archaeon]
MERIRVGLDLGFSNIKSISNNGKEVVFNSLAVESSTKVFTSPAFSFNSKEGFDANSALHSLEVSYDGQDYYVGPYALEQSRNVDSLLTSERVGTKQEKILGLTAIGLLSTAQNVTVDALMLGLPVTEFSLAEKLKKTFSGEHKIVLRNTTTGKEIEKNIVINKVNVMQQGVAVLYAEMFNLDGSINNTKTTKLKAKVGTIEIGFRTTDLVVTKDLRFINPLSGTLELGVSNVYEHIKSYLKSKYNLQKNLSDIEEYVKQGYIFLDGQQINLKHEINSIIKIIVNQIENNIKTMWRDELREFSVIYLAGGGSILFENELKKRFPNSVMVESAQMANAKGYLANLNFLLNKEKYLKMG